MTWWKRPATRKVLSIGSLQLPAEAWEVRYASTLHEAELILRDEQIPVILLDRDLAGSEWRTHIERLRVAAPHSCIVLASTVNDEYLWREVVQRGGFDVVSKPLQQDQLRRRVDNAFLFWRKALPTR